jgi:methionyl-tRNA synthetase
MDGNNVFLLTGTDEHGQKVQQSAAAAGKTPQQFADDVAEQFRALSVALHCSPTTFIRTTEVRHREAVQHLWKRLLERDQIYLGRYQGWYSVRDEAFYAETELIDGKAPTGRRTDSFM